MRGASLLALWLSAVVSCNAAAQSSALRIILEGYKSPRPERYLPGEPIAFRATLENTSRLPVTVVDAPFRRLNQSQSPWKMRMSEEDPGPLCGLEFDRHLGPRPVVVEPGERVTQEVLPLWRLSAGEHELWLEYSIPPSMEEFVASERVPAIRLESNHVRFEVVEPTGVDAEVLARFGGDTCRQLVTTPDVRDTILKEYPTSTYPWVSCCASPQDPLKMISLLRQRVASYDDPSVPKPIAETNAYARVLARQRRDEMVAYLARNPEFVDADRMRLGIAHQSLVAGDLAPAMAQLERLQKVPDLPPWMKEQVEALMAYAKSVEAPPGPRQDPRSER